MASALHSRLAAATARGSSASVALSATFLELLLAATATLRASTAAGSARDASEVRAAAFVYGRLPNLLRELFDAGGLGAEAGADALQEALEAALRAFATHARSPAAKAQTQEGDGMEVDGGAEQEPSPVLGALLTALAQRELISHDTWASLADGAVDEHALLPPMASCGSDYFLTNAPDAAAAREVLLALATDPRAQSSTVEAIRYAIDQAAQSADLPFLVKFCHLLLDTAHVLDVVFVYLEPWQVLGPVRQVLDECDLGEQALDETDTRPIERWGSLSLFLQLALARFELWADFTRHLGADSGFCAHWITSASAAHSLAALDDEARSALKAWLGGLFSEGIEESLIQATDPRVLLRVAPTICQQMLVACELGVVDRTALNEGVQYFINPFFNFTLPGVVRWLVAEIGRTEQGQKRQTMGEVVRFLVRDEGTPAQVLELVAADLVKLDRIAA